MISSDAGMMLCPLAVTFIQECCSHFQLLAKGLPQKAAPDPTPELLSCLPPLGKGTPLVCISGCRSSSLLPPCQPGLCGMYGCRRKAEVLGLFGCLLTHGSLASPPTWLHSAFVGSQHRKGSPFPCQPAQINTGPAVKWS